MVNSSKCSLIFYVACFHLGLGYWSLSKLGLDKRLPVTHKRQDKFLFSRTFKFMENFESELNLTFNILESVWKTDYQARFAKRHGLYITK